VTAVVHRAVRDCACATPVQPILGSTVLSETFCDVPLHNAHVVVPRRGRVRGDDRVALFDVEPLVGVVADGAGGLRGASRAADLLVEHVRAELDAHGAPTTAAAFVGLLSAADHVIVSDANAGETTGIVFAVSVDRIVGASAGDSEAWWIENDRVVDLTVAQLRVRLGHGCARPVGFAVSAGSMGTLRGRLVVATDGLFRFVTATAIVEIVRRAPIDLVATELVEQATGVAGPLDDVGVMVIELG
jgi:serine/threonine protein phosphatase PrpC